MLFYSVLIYYFIYTSSLGRCSPKIRHTKIYVSLFKWFEQTHVSITPVKCHIMGIPCHIDASMLIYKHFAVFSKMIHTKEVHHRNLCKAESDDVRRRRGAQISCSILFSIRIDAYRHVLPIEINKTLQKCALIFRGDRTNVPSFLHPWLNTEWVKEFSITHPIVYRFHNTCIPV